MGDSRVRVYRIHLPTERPLYLLEDPGKHVFVRRVVLQAAISPVDRQIAAVVVILQKLQAFLGTLFRRVPENRFMIFPVKFGMLGSAFSAQHTLQAGNFKRARGREISIALGKQTQIDAGTLNCFEARPRTSCVVCSRVRIRRSI